MSASSPDDIATDIAAGKDVLLKEASALKQLADALGDDFSKAVSMMLSCRGRVICSGVGKSGHVARKIAATLSSTGTAAYYVHPTEASHGDLGMIQKHDIVLALSRSGETSELSDIIQYANRFDAPLIAITAHGNSALGMASQVALKIPDAQEACEETKAPTTSTMMMMALGDALAIAVQRRRGFDAAQFKMFHPGGKLGAMLKTAADLMRTDNNTPLVKSGAPLETALHEISAKNLGCVGVIDSKGDLVGIVTDGDLRRFIASGRQAETVDDVMTRAPQTVSPAEMAGAILHLMNEKKITQVFVCEGARPVGVIHMHDLLVAGVA